MWALFCPPQTPTLLLTPSPLLSNIHFWSTLSPVAPLSPATRRQGGHLFQVSAALCSQSVFLYLSVHLTHPLIISFSFRQSSPPSSRSQCTAWTGPTHLAPFHRTLRKHRSSPSPPPLSTNTFGPRKPDTYPSPAPTPPSPPTSRTMM